MSTAKTTSVLAAITAVIFMVQLGLVLSLGISQQYFEMIHSPEKYTQDIVQHSTALNIIFVLDNIFILFYTCTALFAFYTWRHNGPLFIAITAGVLAVVVGLLDFIENFHIYTLMQQAKDGIAVSAEAIRWQAAESMMKWHLAYAAFFLLGFLVPGKQVLTTFFKYSLWVWFPVTGVLVYAVTNTPYEDLFQWIRFLNLLTGFILICVFMFREKKLNNTAS